MDDLTAFITARLDEDEAATKAVAPLGHVFDMGGERLDDQFAHIRVRHHSEDGRSYSQPDQPATRHFARHDPARVLREVAAKRAIVALAGTPDDDDPYYGGWDTVMELVLRNLAAVWSDHPDYRPEWAA
jgi:hypothetical protein